MTLPRDRVEALDPALVEAHLRAHGWSGRPHPTSARAALFRHPDFCEEVILPLEKGFADFALRMAEVLAALGVVERKRAWELLDELSLPPQNVPGNGAATRARKTAS